MDATKFRPYFRYAGLTVSKFALGHFQVTKDMVFELRQLNYINQWKSILDNEWFHILLEDSSLFVFSSIDGKPSHSYYPCPLDFPSKRQFLSERGLENTQRNYLAVAEDYDLVRQTAPIKEFITPIRYDLDRSAYRRCAHPSAHLHIGWDNQIRIATRREFTPLAFILFVIRQVYPDNWERLFQEDKNLRLGEKLRTDLDEVIPPHWLPEDEIQCYLY